MRTGVYGGTFNPVHLGHVKLAEAYRQALGLDRLLVIPDCQPPHKQAEDLAPGPQRLEMCRLAFAGDPAAQVSDLELRRGSRSYTVDTLEQLHARFPEDTFYLIMGGDMFLTVTQWQNPQRIFQLAVLCAGSREPGEQERLRSHGAFLRERYGAESRIIPFSPLPISSTQIRARVRGGQSLEGLVPPQVARYIQINRLYRD
ncbi:MAG TPA: nicotinate (nicotinamide) nucleotide adenylyltransferase [Candidatus Anaerotruncus excrementipullorum]|uniref:Probable nicotinate-nucleotide adenylyltransferase n=1 Tax=Candidatus Anaerotruncus excrementipullorum TaxID=2838465 RepID=A0A9D2B7F8_9FIRM|nr:nicotinate (nicotinamide) nucleotide adenylyltransferase [Candidatus Anaerotruncus excrementipullorum]